MKYENPIMEILRFNTIDILTASGGVEIQDPSDGIIEDNNQLPDEW